MELSQDVKYDLIRNIANCSDGEVNYMLFGLFGMNLNEDFIKDFIKKNDIIVDYKGFADMNEKNLSMNHEYTIIVSLQVDPGNEAAFAAFFKHYQGIISRIINSQTKNEIDTTSKEGLLYDCMFYLLHNKIVEKFDITIGYRFMTYAIPQIRYYIYRTTLKEGIIKIPEKIKQKVISIEKCINRLNIDPQNISQKDYEAISAAENVSYTKLKELLNYICLIKTPLSLDNNIINNDFDDISESNYFYKESSESKTISEYNDMNAEICDKLLECLSEKEKIVVRYYYLDELTIYCIVEEINKQFNTEIYNYYNVQKMIYRSVQKMRLYAKEKELQQFTRIA